MTQTQLEPWQEDAEAMARLAAKCEVPLPDDADLRSATLDPVTVQTRQVTMHGYTRYTAAEAVAVRATVPVAYLNGTTRRTILCIGQGSMGEDGEAWADYMVWRRHLTDDELAAVVHMHLSGLRPEGESREYL